jgi:predicted MFS family arabinose efflux permease
MSPAFHRLVAVAAGLRGADQIAVAAVPLIAAALFAAGPDRVGLLVAAQGAAWLLFSLPAGVAIDRTEPLAAMRAATLVAILGLALTLAGLVASSLVLVGIGAFVAAGAAVIGLLAETTSVQRLVPGADLPRANARLQIVQSTAMLAGPLLAGVLVAQGSAAGAIGLALLLALGAFALGLGFPRAAPSPARPRRPLAELAEGLAFVRGQPLLRGVVACALLWNTAFFALAAMFAPYALDVLALSPGAIGFAQAAMGVGSILAALAAPRVFAAFEPRAILIFGPASSTLGALLLLAAPAGSVLAPALGYFLLGFGPILWFVCQNTIRQLVTPQGLLGRVGSVVQVAIYGVRSLGALAGGFVASAYGFAAGLAFVVVLFGCSTAVVFVSALIGLRAMPADARRA